MLLRRHAGDDDEPEFIFDVCSTHIGIDIPWSVAATLVPALSALAAREGLEFYDPRHLRRVRRPELDVHVRMDDP